VPCWKIYSLLWILLWLEDLLRRYLRVTRLGLLECKDCYALGSLTIKYYGAASKLAWEFPCGPEPVDTDEEDDDDDDDDEADENGNNGGSEHVNHDDD
jgi:hypothetical protein